MQTIRINQEQDEYIHTVVDNDLNRPVIDLDLQNTHGRRTLSIRVDGMTIASVLIDSDLIEADTPFERYCPYCAEEINIISSKTHKCNETTKTNTQ